MYATKFLSLALARRGPLKEGPFGHPYRDDTYLIGCDNTRMHIQHSLPKIEAHFPDGFTGEYPNWRGVIPRVKPAFSHTIKQSKAISRDLKRMATLLKPHHEYCGVCLSNPADVLIIHSKYPPLMLDYVLGDLRGELEDTLYDLSLIADALVLAADGDVVMDIFQGQYRGLMFSRDPFKAIIMPLEDGERQGILGEGEQNGKG